jgi:hypothetical protein
MDPFVSYMFSVYSALVAVFTRPDKFTQCEFRTLMTIKKVYDEKIPELNEKIKEIDHKMEVTHRMFGYQHYEGQHQLNMIMRDEAIQKLKLEQNGFIQRLERLNNFKNRVDPLIERGTHEIENIKCEMNEIFETAKFGDDVIDIIMEYSPLDRIVVGQSTKPVRRMTQSANIHTITSQSASTDTRTSKSTARKTIFKHSSRSHSLGKKSRKGGRKTKRTHQK